MANRSLRSVPKLAKPLASNDLQKEKTPSKITAIQPLTETGKPNNAYQMRRFSVHNRADVLRQIIMGFNVLMLVIGIIFTIFGCMMIWSSTMLEGNLRQGIAAYAKFAGLENSRTYKMNLLNGLMQFTSPVGELLLMYGGCTVLISAVGFYGLLRKRRFYIFMYVAVLLAKILISFTIVTAYLMDSAKVTNVIKEIGLRIIRDYRSGKGEDASSTLINVVMPVLQCCGLDSGNDFSLATKFDRTYEVPNHVIVLPYPITCCKMDSNYNRLFHECPVQFTEYNSNIARGCWPIVQYYFRIFYSSVAYAITIFSFLELVMVTLAIYMCILNANVRLREGN